MFRIFLGLVYSFVVAFWTLSFFFGVFSLIREFKKEWYLPDPNMFGRKAGFFYISDRLLWILANIGVIVISIVQLIEVFAAVRAL